MKSWKKRPLLVTALVLLVATAMLTLSFAAFASDTNNDSGISGLQGAEFTSGLLIVASSGTGKPSTPEATLVFNGAPYALDGFVLQKLNGSIHVYITQCSQVVLDLGFKVGDTVTVFCTASQVTDLNVGDFIEVYGFTARGQLIRGDDTVLPAPFSY